MGKNEIENKLNEMFIGVTRTVSMKMKIPNWDIKTLEQLLNDIRKIDDEVFGSLNQYLSDYNECILDWTPINSLRKYYSSIQLILKTNKY